MSDQQAQNYEPLGQITIADRQYDLLERYCENCGIKHFEIWRWCGSHFSRYKMPGKFITDDFENFVEKLDEQLIEQSHEILQDFWHELNKVNSGEGISADFSFSFRLIDYARLKISALQKLNYFDVLLSEEAQTEAADKAVRAAFELGFAVAQHRTMASYEEYVLDGIAMSEWRNAGLPKARQERLRQGARTRGEILRAAERLYEEDPALARNDSETARRIMKLRLPGLQRGDNQQLGIDAITRHLRGARRAPKP